ncbi:aldo/keto reductase family oxidoreductase [Lactiplantibacillus xiangfangensis]|uniref:Oxidoreductase n=1 Tax=Lactiplantibacillus xiangfangensis TaxID=942150 RepID=A0A0R2ML43_9LACO|nr:aldo/keto reductase [Lactiplantibacillus xiangfangensis]KRO14327.1 oxidoreductase [Lactiplantibacillus xiangfangensis]
MKTINLGHSGLQASAVALGIMRMDALNVDQATKVIETAVNLGINYVDSADIYGGGKSSEIFGAALKQSSVSRDQLYIQSKGGIVPGKRYDFSKQHILDAVDGELKRLGVDYLDSFLLHRPDALMEPEDVAAAFDKLQASGKVRHFGVSNFNPGQVDLLQAALNQRLMINQLQFGIMHTNAIDFGLHTNMQDDRSIDHDGGVIEYARLHKMTIQAWSPYQYGNFAGIFLDNPKFPKLNAAMQDLADEKHTSKSAIATAWILRHPAKFQVILGTMNPTHLAENAAGADINLTRQEWYDIYFAAGNDLP